MAAIGRSWRRLSLLVLALVVSAGTARGVDCVGDCNGDGMVTVAELIIGVRISLGQASIDECPAFDATPDGELRIDELIAAVGNLLSGCPATPTATATVATPPTGAPSATATEEAPPTVTATPGTPFSPTAAAATPTRTATGDASPTHTGAAGTPTATTTPLAVTRWLEQPLEVTESTCLAPITDAFADDLASRSACEQIVELTEPGRVIVEDCTGTRVDGTLDDEETIRLTYPPVSDTVGDCTVDLATSSVVPAGAVPTIATYTFAVDFSGDDCPLADCAILAEGAWSKQ